MLPKDEAVKIADKLKVFCKMNVCGKCIFFNKPTGLCNINGTPEKWDCRSFNNVSSLADYRGD